MLGLIDVTSLDETDARRGARRSDQRPEKKTSPQFTIPRQTIDSSNSAEKALNYA
jgi:hypothetical protein